MPRDALAPKRDPTPEPPAGVPGGYLALLQPSVFFRAYELEQEGTRLARIERAGFRRFRVTTADGDEPAPFAGDRLTIGPLVARAAPGGAVIGPKRLTYRAPDVPYARLDDHDGPLARFGDLRGSGFSAEGKLWVANRLLAERREGVRALAACVLVLRERPGAFRA